MALARIGREIRARDDGAPPSASAAFAASATARPPWPSACRCRRSRDRSRTTTASNPCACRPGERRRGRHAWTSPSRHGATAIATSSSARRRSARTVSESDTGSAPPRELDVRDPAPAPGRRRRARAGCAATQQTTGSAVEALGEAVAPPRRSGAAACAGVYGSVITWAPSAAGRPSPRVRFACSDVEAARAELERARPASLTSTVVAELDRAGQPRIGDARDRRRPRSRTSSSWRSTTAVTMPAAKLSGTSRGRPRRARA